MDDKEKKLSQVVNFLEAKKRQDADTEAVQEGDDLSSYIDGGLEAFNEAVEAGAKGFVGIVVDADNNPTVLFVGDLDVFATMGMLDYAKQELSFGLLSTNLEFAGE